ncbi:MAG TPA: glycerophosphodiester phosphodiesterase [Vicinamibacterales bacterium]|nr:glycerophosphodiester phosphodiesterase [Vicinamibacterales bacterium]
MSSHPRPERRPLVYAHRGGAALRPENTLAAFDHGLALGADGLELDVHLSRDGAVMVHHDDTLDRTTNGRGPIRDARAEDLAALDAGYRFIAPDPATPVYAFRGQGIAIPRLATVLGRYPGARLIIELKDNEPELARRTIDEIRGADATDRVALGSFFWRVLREARLYEPRIPTGASKEETRWALYRSYVRWPLGRTRYRELQVPERSGSTTVVSPRFIAHAHRAGLPVKVWTVDAAPDIRRLLSWGADAIISDRPDVAVAVVQSWAAGGGNAGPVPSAGRR